MTNQPEMDCSPTTPQLCGRAALLAKHRWVTFLLPFVVFMLLTSVEPTPPADKPDEAAVEEPAADRHESKPPEETSSWPAIPYRFYPLVYTLKILLTLAAMAFVWPGYREFPFRVSPLAVVVGVVGIVVWVGLCKLNLEQDYVKPALDRVGLGWLIASGARSAFNPLDELGSQPALAWGFLAVRFVGLVAVVAVIEEFLLRGLLMRFVVDADWWEVPIGKVNTLAVLIGTLLYPVLTHPGELLAAVAWFSLVTWLMIKTRNIWDCVVAHAITNLLLGIYVVKYDQWHLM